MEIKFLNRAILALVAGYIMYHITEVNVSMAVALIVILIIIMTGE